MEVHVKFFDLFLFLIF